MVGFITRLSWHHDVASPVSRFEDHLTGNGIVTDADVRAMRDHVKRDLDAAVDFAEASPYPDPKDLLVDMFAE